MKFGHTFNLYVRYIVRGIFTLLILGATSAAFATDALLATVHKTHPIYPKINYGAGKQAELLKRGEYLVKLGDCIACHTSEDSNAKSFAGGLAIATPFGKIYTPNITPDKKYGIGNWTLQQFAKALHEGISPQGKYYYPAFPYLYFNKVTADDLRAIKAYLDAVPPVAQENRKNSMMFPFNWRFLQLGWRLLFFHFQKTGAYKNDPQQSPEWNRGNYIVQGLAHCGMCHTPSHYLVFKSWNLAAPVEKYDLTGAFVEGFFAPNITATTIKNTRTEQLADVFLKDKLLGGGTVQGPMAEANHDSLIHLSFNDIKSIHTYLSSVHSETPPHPSAGGKGLAVGKKIFDTYCSGCHLTGAGGAPKFGDATQWDPLVKKGLNVLYKNAINGIRGMPAKGTCTSCTNDEIESAVQYMVEQVKPGTAKTLGVPAPDVPPPALTMADGKNIYNSYCSACHNPGSTYPGAPIIGDKQTWAPLIAQNIDKLMRHAIKGYKNMPARGGCASCNDAQIKAAVLYMVQQSKSSGNYDLW